MSDQLRVIDNDRDEISIWRNGKEIRGWSYRNETERRMKMLAAREFAEGWFQAEKSDPVRDALAPEPDLVEDAQENAKPRGWYWEDSLTSQLTPTRTLKSELGLDVLRCDINSSPMQYHQDLIVKAVNGYDASQALVEVLVAALESYTIDMDGWNDTARAARHSVQEIARYRKAKAAITRARGETS